MKNKSNPTPHFDSPDTIQDKLNQIGERISSEQIHQLVHPQQELIPEWLGADVRVTSDFVYEPKDFMEGHDLLVRTEHAKALTWLFLELRDALDGWLDFGNKYGFYGDLAQAALNYLAANQPESADAKPLLNAVLAEAFRCLQYLQEVGKLPTNDPIVCHQRDVEGRQYRIKLEDGGSRL